MKTKFKHLWRMTVMTLLVVLALLGVPMALSADASVARKDAGLQAIPVAGTTTIYKGAWVCLDTSGYLVPAADTAGYRFVGAAAEAGDNSGGSNGDITVRCYTEGVFLATFTSITQAMVGDPMYVADDATLDDTSTNHVEAGRLVQYVSTTSGWVDIGQRASTTATIQKSITGEGYSLNLISVTSTATVGEGTRALRANLTTSAGIASGDLQCFHGYLTLGSGASLAANAAVYPLSGWIDVPDGTSIGAGCVIAGCRVIFDPNNNDLSAIGGGGESALFYGQTWASTGAIDHGLAVVAGAGTTIQNMLHLGGSGTVTRIIDLTEWDADTMVLLVEAGLTDVTATAHFKIAAGDADSHAAIVAEVGASCIGSMYLSTVNGLWINEAGTWTNK